MSSASESMQMDVDSLVPHSPGSDSDDAYNSSSAKVYFGPLLSPEKKMAHMFEPNTPRIILQDKKSGPSAPPDTSALLEPLELQDNLIHADNGGENEAEQELLHPPEETPMITIIQQDEPSSALASRIIRAHDNPSPPPGAVRRLSGSRRRSSQLAGEVDITKIDCGARTTSEGASQHDSCTEGSSLLPVMSISRSPTPTRMPAKKRQSDLISFESPIKDMPSTTISDTEALAQTTARASIDSLLFGSPDHVINEQDSNTKSKPDQITGNAEDEGSIFQVPESGGPVRRRSARLSALPRPNFSDMNAFGSPSRQLINLTPTPSPLRKRVRERQVEPISSSDPFLSQIAWPAEQVGPATITPTKAKREKKRIKLDPPNTEGDSQNMIQSFEPRQTTSTTQAPGHIDPSNTDSQADDSNISPVKGVDVEMGASGISTEAVADVVTSRLARIQRPPPGTFQTQFMSPVRSGLGNFPTQQSPLRMTLDFSSESTNRTPARRVPVSAQTPTQSIVTGQGSHFSKFKLNTPVFTRPTGNVDMSPQRVATSRPTMTVFGNVFGKGKEKEVFTFVPPTTNSSTANMRLTDIASSKVSSMTAQVDRSSEHGEKANDSDDSSSSTALHSEDATQTSGSGSDSKSTPSTSSSDAETSVPPQSDLKPGPSRLQSAPAAGAKSRIPRAGILSKPASNLPLNRVSKLPTPASHRVAKTIPSRSRLPSPTKPLNRSSRVVSASQSISGPSQVAATSSGVAAKRKFSTNVRIKPTPQKPPSPKPIVMRQVMPGMFGGNLSRSTTALPSHIPALPSSSSPEKPMGPIQARIIKEVVPRALDGRGPFSAIQTRGVLQDEPKDEEKATPTGGAMQSSQQSENVEPSQDIDTEINSTIPDIATLSMDEPKVRRSTRNQRSSQPPETDVFGAVTSVAPDGGSTRRRAGTGRSKSNPIHGTFYPPEGIALKTLTNSNTNKNQRYYATLETNIVRKAGNRPESPSMKLRTILEKQKEEQGRLRAARAKRRRADSSDSEGEAGDSCMSIDGAPYGHLRGPGDEEDYETPTRIANATGKRVKWDRGLGTSVFLDEIVPQGALRYREGIKTVPEKGCLVFDSNRMKLDSLGNLVNADESLELSPETVVVTKYVYDNDEEPEVYIPPPPPPKVTRSKSRRSK